MVKNNIYTFRERDKYFNHKKPQRPDVTKLKSPDEPLAKIARLAKDKRKERDDTDHVAEITQLKERIASMQKTITQKNNELTQKQGEMTAMKAKLFNEEKIIKEKMKKMQAAHDNKVSNLQQQIQSLQTELSKAKRDASKSNSAPIRRNKELFPGAKKKDLIPLSSYRPKDQQDAKDRKSKKETYERNRMAGDRGTDSPATAESRSQSASPAPVSNLAYISSDKAGSRQESRSQSRSISRSPRSRSKSLEQHDRSRSSSPLVQTNHRTRNLDARFGSHSPSPDQKSLDTQDSAQGARQDRDSMSQSPEIRHGALREDVQSRSSSPEHMDNNGDQGDHQQINYGHDRQRSRTTSRSFSRSLSR